MERRGYEREAGTPIREKTRQKLSSVSIIGAIEQALPPFYLLYTSNAFYIEKTLPCGWRTSIAIDTIQQKASCSVIIILSCSLRDNPTSGVLCLMRLLNVKTDDDLNYGNLYYGEKYVFRTA